METCPEETEHLTQSDTSKNSTILYRNPSCSLEIGNSVDGSRHTFFFASNAVLIEELSQQLLQRCDIPIADQIILCGPPYTRLDARKTLESYMLPSTENFLYVYDRRMLSSKKKEIDIQFPLALSSTLGKDVSEEFASEGSRILSVASSPILRALAEYENQFVMQLKRIQSLESFAEKKYNACQALSDEIDVQSESIVAAVSNLQVYKAAIERHFSSFYSEYQTANARHLHLLQHMDEYIASLQSVALHPSLCTASKKTLYDCIPHDRERAWAEQCQQSFHYFQSQVDTLHSFHDQICEKVTQMEPVTRDPRIPKLLNAIQENARELSEIGIQMKQNLSSVVMKISDTSADVESSSMMYASTTALEVCRSLDAIHMRQQHEMIPESEKLDASITSSVQEMINAKIASSESVHSYLHRVSILQSQIRDFESTLSTLKSALQIHKSHFHELEHLEQLPASYRACLVEVQRRHRYGKRFSTRIQAMAEELATLREEEVHYRETFLIQFGQHLPRDFIPGLAEKPSHCEFRMRPFDQNLPEIALENGMESSSDSGFVTGNNSTSQIKETRVCEEADDECLRKRCADLEAQLSQLAMQFPRDSHVSNESGEDSGCEFPLVLALAATATEMGQKNGLKDYFEDKVVGSREIKERHARAVKELQALQAENERLHEIIATLQRDLDSKQSFSQDITVILDMEDTQSLEAIKQRVCELIDAEKVLRQELDKSCVYTQNAVETNTISFQSFDIGDLALFLPTLAPSIEIQRRVYLAFHLGCPHRFLSEESITSFSACGNRYPDYVIGRIVLIDEQVASESLNPYGLLVGTTFYVLTVASLHENA